ncbi:MAG: L-rhamnose isomerase [Trichococcus sp.]|uniref:L-rhamnose isomerase n=2 Tax=Trichococcus sp. TaxID=1985464 RepID=UPI003C6A2F35
MTKPIEEAYTLAKQKYAAIGVDTDAVLEKLSQIKVSLQCWQGDDVLGFMFPDQALTGGISVSGNYPGKATTPAQLRADLDKALSLIPGNHKVNLHAIYVDTDEKIDLDQIEPKHYEKWVQWAKEKGLGLDFNPTCFSHPKSTDGTLSSNDPETQAFWIEHVKRSRKVAAYFGEELNQTCVNNIWIPDGYKDNPIDKMSPRVRLRDALDQCLKEKFDDAHMLDAVEGKLFGIGAESFTTGSNDFYLSYALTRDILWTIDAGHFHPTEDVSDKFTAFLPFGKGLMLHVSRPIRWDSDHVVILDEATTRIGETLVRNDLLDKTFIGMDFFDATINRVAAMVIGARSTVKSLLLGMLSPIETLKDAESTGDFTTRLAVTEEMKSYPFGAVWEFYCQQQNVPAGTEWLTEVKDYEQKILTERK